MHHFSLLSSRSLYVVLSLSPLTTNIWSSASWVGKLNLLKFHFQNILLLFERQRETELPLAGLGQAEGRGLELRPDLSRGWQGAACSRGHLRLSRVHLKRSWSEQSQDSSPGTPKENVRVPNTVSSTILNVHSWLFKKNKTLVILHLEMFPF